MERLLKDSTENWKTKFNKICDTLIEKVPKTDHHVSTVLSLAFLFFFTHPSNALSFYLLHPYSIDILLNDATLH